MHIRRLIVGLGALLAIYGAGFVTAHAAPPANISYTVGVCDPWYPSTRCIKPNADGSINISGSVTAGAAFAPTGQASLAVTTTSGRVALPAASANVTLVNSGAQTAYFLLGDVTVAATTATGYPLQAGSSITLAVGTNTYVAAITSTSTATLGVTSGTGVPALAGGGSSSGSGGGAVTVADGANVSQGFIADPVVASGASGTMESYLRTIKDSAVSTAASAVNLSQVNGVTGLAGNGVTGTGSQRVTIASDNTAFSVNGTLQTQTDTVMVGGVNVKEINAVTPLMGNGVTGTGSQRVTIASDNTAFTVNAAQATASSLNAQVQGPAASGASVSGNPLLEGCRAATTSPTAVTDGQAIAAQCGAEGARVTRPYAIKEVMVRGSTGAVTNTAQTSIIASAGGSLKNYITAIQCANSGATTSILTFTDAATTVLINPAGGGGNWTFPIPLVTAAATAFQVTPGSSSTSQYCSAQGYTGL